MTAHPPMTPTRFILGWIFLVGIVPALALTGLFWAMGATGTLLVVLGVVVVIVGVAVTA